MDDVRWFAMDALQRWVVPGLRERGLRIALEGNAPARAVICMNSDQVREAWRHARRSRARLALYCWDLPPWRLAGGRPNPVVELFGHVVALPRLWGGFPERPNFYSRLIWALRHADQVWAPSLATVADCRSVAGVEAVHLHYCYDSARFTELDLPRDPRTVVAVSRLVPSKAHDSLLQAVARLTPMPRVRIIGRGELAPDLRREAERLGVPCSVETDLDDAGVVDAYRRATVVVCPSTFEGLGLTGVEALACGAQVVASDIPPHREFLGDHVRYAPPGDPVALAAVLEAALAGPALPPADLRALSLGSAVDRFHVRIRALLDGAA